MKYITIILMIGLLAGCASSGGKRRGSLSDGVEKASDNNDGDRRVHTTYDPPEPSHNYNDDYNRQEDRFLGGSSYNDDDDGTFFINKPSFFTLKLGTGLLSHEHFYALNGFTLETGWKVEDNGKFSFYGGVEHAPVKETDEFSSSLRDGTTIGRLGLEIKYLTSPDYTFLGHYFSLGLGTNLMGWSYKNPLVAWDDYGNEELIYNDMLQGYEIYIGTGVNIFNPYKVKLGTEVTAGVILWDWTTMEGFDNDLFSPFFYLKLRLLFGIGN